MSVYVATAFVPDPFVKVTYILDRLVEHETIWTDYIVGRREVSMALLFNPANAVFEVWKVGDGEPQIVGIIMLTDHNPRVDIKGHFLFFDGRLKGKEEVLTQLMRWTFEKLDVHRISVEIPDHAYILIDYVRDRLGFRFEGEGRTIKERPRKRKSPRGDDAPTHEPAWQLAQWGSRKYQAIRWQNQWRDLMLLSITRDEFTQWMESNNGPVRDTGGTPTR